MIDNNWDKVLEEEFEKNYFKKIQDFINQEYNTKTV